MAKSDHKRLETAAVQGQQNNQNQLTNLRNTFTDRGQQLNNRFNVAADRSEQDYGNMMGQYGSMLNRPASNQNFGAYGGYQNFADTGGYSGQDVQDLRQRAIDPLRGVYERAQSELSRNRALQGGYSPNFAAASTKMNRDLGHQVADTNVNVNASLADAIRQGKLAGLSGMTDIDKARMQESIANRGADISTMGAMNQLYSATPGQTNMYGNFVNDSNKDLQNTQNMSNDLYGRYLSGLNNMAQTPGDFQSVLGNIGGVTNLFGNIMKMFPQFSQLPGGGNLSSRQTTPNSGTLPTGGTGLPPGSY